MNETDILIQAMQIDSSGERDAFLTRECEGDPEKLAAIRRVLSLEIDLKKKFASTDDPELRKHIEEVLSTHGRASSSAADDATGVMAGNAPDDDDSRLKETSDSDSKTGQNVTIAGRYVLQNKIGEGGMGEVWAAKQIAPVKRKVALKLIKRGMDSRAVLARFEQERQALAMMDHPNIARVLDGGVTETGQSFFVMELVKPSIFTAKGTPSSSTSSREAKRRETSADILLFLFLWPAWRSKRGFKGEDRSGFCLPLIITEWSAASKAVAQGLSSACAATAMTFQ